MTNYRWFVNGIQEKKPSAILIMGFYLLMALGLGIFHLYTSGFGVLESWYQRAIHLAFVLVIAYTLPFVKMLKDNCWQAAKGVCNGIFLAGSLGFFLYLLTQYPAVQMRSGIPNDLDKLACVVLIVLLVAAAKAYIGWPLPILVGIFLLYTFLGPWMPGPLRHNGFSFNKVVDHLFMSVSGIFGSALGASAVFIAVFIIFGNFLIHTGVGEYFIKFATLLAGRFRGGPAKVAVVASALMGTIHGSGPGNVATTGTFTIPLMKKLGYRPEFAGAVEASASTGGIIMPPVMGATAFIMAEMTRIPYSRIMFAALIPAVLYFGSIFFMVHLEALKHNLTPIPEEDMPSRREILRELYMLLPIVGIIVFLVMGMSPMKAGLYAILLTVVLSCFRKDTRLNLERLVTALESGAKEVVTIALACGTAGILAGLISLTGLGLKLSYMINALANGHLIIGLLMTMLVCIILGMGMPVTAAYILVATTTSRILTDMNVSVLAANMFVFYFASVSAITPPVALSSYTAAGLAGADMNKTGWEAVKLALAAFLVPYMFVYSPTLLWEGQWWQILQSLITAVIGILMLSVGVHGWNLKGKTNLVLRILLLVGSLLMIDAGLTTDLIGLGIVIVSYVVQRILYRRAAPVSAA